MRVVQMFSFLVLLGFVPCVISAQNQTNLQGPDALSDEPSHPVLEIAPGFGYVFGGGAEDPAPSLTSATVSVTFWASRRFGFSVSAIYGIGQDLYDEPIVDPTEPIGDTYPREFRGKEGLRYYRVTMRYRRHLSEKVEMNLGGAYSLVEGFERS